MATSERIPVLVIGGPTATGKTAAAVEVAQSHGGEIVSADSMQIYRRLDVGTAKPTPEEAARAVFHLVDIVEPTATYTAADFQRDADAAIRDIRSRGRLPIVCGGTGLYLRALLGGLTFPPGAEPETDEIRERLTREAKTQGAAALHARLAAVDPATAARLPVADTRRVIRALEVWEHTGEPFSALARVDESRKLLYNARTFVLTCPRPLLYERIEARVDVMMAQGWVEEVETLRAEGVTLQHQSMQAIGYRHLQHWLDEGGDLADAVSVIKRDTRRFAKRQLTWFRKEPATYLEWGGATPFAAVVEALRSEASRLLAGGD